MRSSLASSVKRQARARKTSRARTLELGRLQFRILAVTSASIIRAGPSYPKLVTCREQEISVLTFCRRKSPVMNGGAKTGIAIRNMEFDG